MKLFKSRGIIVLLFTLAMLFMTACGSSEDTAGEGTDKAENDGAKIETNSSEHAEGEPVDVLFSTHEVGSATYAISASLGTLWEEYLPEGSSVDVQPTSPGGMGAPYLFEQGQADIAFVNGAPAKWAFEEGTLGNGPTQDYRALVGSLTGVSAITFFTQDFIDEHGVDTLEEVVEQQIPIRIGTSPRGSMDEKITSMALEYLGASYEDVKSWGGDVIHGGGSELTAMARDGKVDMYLNHTSVNSSTMTEMAMTSDIKFIQWGEDLLSHFDSQGFERITIPANTWEGQTEEIINAGTPDSVYVHKDMSEDVAYALVKGISENREQLVEQFASLEPFNPKEAWKPGKLGGIELHPGAEKYYKEMGYME
ncbi:TAXI family TRAP transporter solute-binding subunit [Salinibacillus xinjiangensis]|uniref:TAXI family TRAP transporter solute-binding subunit n=1 Tax=Salinibacillus xinjiangensis TaxID=1229268 RepID=A0A6G1X1Z1_9BACI|nr:TAXI family TRAP transporter solute-binding subunit [Salinibacillus xinjiangensis]MRG85017.1 TAXI family TRAP transporter solute-binding subunit [Salinibacillus xinjiangensis]